ncbi:hypothetical protein [Paludifilum halophilum]|uniref:Uncharacterized protein n=1 Tax=Paludifilum halophilum TaxID=1642702 RepID=A0A235B7X7_9BACL|nr:hypothetical protein [Paludifilum halophilum]OYD07695.1 hypothetical protein CHM34_09465 [Paludifilum halophilum]
MSPVPPFRHKRPFFLIGILLWTTMGLCLYPALFPDREVFASGVEFDTSQPVLGDYAGEIREPFPRADGLHHLDTPRMIEKLHRLGVNTYFYLIWHQRSDWDDLRREFLPAAKKEGIDVWVYLVPPSEARGKASEPYGTDFIAWFRAIGRLSRSFDNLKGVVIDDFNHNLSFFTPAYVKRMRKSGHSANPELRFYPQIYYPSIRAGLIHRYRPFIDGVVMTFRDGKYRNTHRTHDLEQQIERVHNLLRPEKLPFILMIHASKLSATPANPSVPYVKKSLQTGIDRLHRGHIQGLVTYVLQKEWFPEKKDRSAYAGYGYGSLFISPGTGPPSGGNGEIKQIIRPEKNETYRLAFSHFDVYPHSLSKGEYVKQLLIDGRIVWERDVKARQPERWYREQVNLTDHLKGKKEAVLTLRLLRKKNRSKAWLYTGFDHLEPRGFRLTDPGFELNRGWFYLTSHPSVIGDTIMFDPQRRLRVYLTAMTLFTSYDLYREIQQVHPAWKKTADRALTGVIEEERETAKAALEELVQKLINHRNLSPDRRKALLNQCRKLDHLLTIQLT